jgi:signal transduction histidine kinase
LLADPATDRQDVARALLEPTRASEQVAEIYQHLMQEARGLGVRLRPHSSEPVFGPLVRDLDRAEILLARHSGRILTALHEIDSRLRGEHADRLQNLLRLGPRTRVDEALLSRWIEAVSAEPGRIGWTLPVVRLPQAAVAFPLPEGTLVSIFSNLLRNALVAAIPSPIPAIEIRAEQGRDGTGRRMVSLWVADSSARPLDIHDIEQRPADRGLGIVREATRTWGGEIALRAEEAPLRKAVGVRFPAPPEEKT